MYRLIKLIKPYSKYFLVAWIIFIVTFSSIPSLPVLKIETKDSTIRLDYLIHFCVYGILAFLAYLNSSDNIFKLNLRKYIIITTVVILFAILDEFHQKLIPGRSFNLKDILSNFSGIIAALIFYLIVFRMIGNKHSGNT
jgi:VanZ family protein